MTTTTKLLQRRQQGRLIGGVCAGVAHRWRLDLAVVRFVVLLLSAAGGAGVLAYGVAWALLPAAPADEVRDPSAAPGRADRAEAIAVLAIGLGLTLMLRGIGVWFSDPVGIVAAVAAVGVALIWGRAESLTELGRGGAFRIALGVLLVGSGFLLLVFLSGDLRTMGRTLLSAGLAAAGVALLIGPYVARLADQLGAERRARIRVEERAEIAAHLHDGVLQTLAMIQRRSDDPREVATLARRQERELREWLHGTTPVDGTTLSALMKQELGTVEDAHGVRIELVCVGDEPADDRIRSLVAATREAATNAARHAGVERVDVYVEVEADVAIAFVRDRGVGFDPSAVGDDRRGLAESIVGRMQRAGGEASVRTQPGDGTEVRLRLPLRADRVRSGS